MKVSIVIPVYNTEKYLEECVDSALSQTYQDLEIIVVNDGSTDRSPEILKKYSNKIIIISKENGGAASALNAGIRKATGEWIKRLDADDVLYSNAIEDLVSETRNLKGNRKNYILYGNYDIVNADGKLVERKVESNNNHLDNFDLNIILLDHFSVNQDTMLIHRSAFDEYGFFDESLCYGEDYELCLRFTLLHDCRLHLVPKLLAKYRFHKAQITYRKLKNTIEIENKIRNDVLSQLDPTQRNKYKMALMQYQRNKPLLVQGRQAVIKILEKIFSQASLGMIHGTYHKIRYRKYYT